MFQSRAEEADTEQKSGYRRAEKLKLTSGDITTLSEIWHLLHCLKNSGIFGRTETEVAHTTTLKSRSWIVLA